MLEVQEERAAAAGPAATHFNKKERGKKEREDAKDGRGNLGNIGNAVPGSGSRNVRAKAPLAHTGSSHQLITPPCSVVLGAPSMHANRLKNSPSANTQSPKPKTDVMVRSPPVMSPSQLDSKLPNQGKPGSTGSQSQASPCDSKTLVNKGGNLALKNGQGLASGQGLKVKVKRERSTSVESYEQPETGAPTADDKDSSRVKRMCVAERRQPYSGADWCSGGESDEDDKGFFNCNSSDVKPQDSMSHNTSNAGLSRSSTPSHNALGGVGPTSDPVGGPKGGSKVVYVFTTEMANKAADAVLTGHTENIITFHMKNISNSKDKAHLLLNNQPGGPLRNDSKPPQQPSSHPQDQNHQSGSKPSLPGLSEPPPSQPSTQGGPPGGLAQDGASSAGLDPKSLPGSSPSNHSAPNEQPPVNQSEPGHNQPQGGEVGQMGGPGVAGLTPQQQQQQQLAQELLNMEANTEGLSQEQLEHRQRSLQTLRDIQRMLFPDDRDAPPPGPPQPHGGPHEGMSEGGQRRPEQGPLQAMMAQSQSLGPPSGGGGPRSQGPPFGPPHGPRDMPPFPQDEMGPHMGGPGGCVDGDQMTPEQAQVAWLKLQQEFYEEKKRKQEMQHRPLPPDMMMHPHGPRGMMRGPPPPYQMGPGEMWGGPGGGPPEHYQERMGMGPGPRGMPSHMQRMPGFPQGMMNPEMEGPPRPGMGWPDDMPPRMGDGRGFPGGPGGMFGGPGGRGERFPNPQSVQEAMFHQGMAAEKGLPPGMMMDMQRMMGHQRGSMEPGNGMGMFPRMPGEGPMSPSSRLGPMGGRDMGPEFGMGPGPGPHMHPSKLRESAMNMSPEEIMRMRAGGGPPMENMGPQGRPMQGPHFSEQAQPGDFPLGPGRPFPGGPVGGMRGMHGEQAFGLEHRPTPTGGNGRHNHLPPASGPPQGQRGRKPADLNVQAGGGNSPSVNPLKSPPLRQVQSPMMGSPSGNLKSPQTPSQLAGMLSGPPGPNAPPAPANSAPMKSPHSMMGSAGASPVHMRSPSLPNPSPGWASSPKPPMQSPGVPPQPGKPPLSMTSPNMMGNMDQGGNGPPAPPSSGAPSGPMSLPGSVPSGSPYTIPPEPTLSQNPLSIMMSRMSKFAMPSSTPLYHDAIKTVASSDDDSPPARSPNLPSMNNNGMVMNHHQGGPRMMGPGSSGPMAALSPLGMTPMGSQPLSHGMPPQMPSPNAPNMGPGMMPHGMMMPPNPQDPGMNNPQMMPQGRMGYPPHRGQGYPLTQSPSQQGPFSPHNGPGPQGFPGHPMGFQGEGGPMGSRMGNMAHGGGVDGGMCKPNTPGGPEFNNMQGGFSDADLHEVMRPGASGIPEFDLSRIIPSEKPSQTLSYFPRGGGGDNPGGKPPHPSGFPMQGMMGDGPPRMGIPMQGMGGMQGGPGGGMGPQDMPMGNPGHNNMRPPGFMGQGMMGPQHRMMGPGGMMQGRQMPHPGPGGSPNMMMSLQGMGGPPQQTMMMGGQMRPRGMDMDMGFSPGPGMF
ncbi:B-cell CLL/lymphoma 9 protein isoform X1 [Hypomesus transpacificus]|uniref:B-cell CLL/lymphoma 9 protein isoform X1 n=1 Tax=Hypomesus transpacificus TaxID=137520 RepID=UPI001F07922E|nr:B-cell CLL/lymphoma 9 protein isoform X1 [Hypomesus transpacificus]XP_046902367.1 B-cell CLL/lymphoma 9 protein isoform X1 [Hypomesus transpacificus]XP_046902368.1 B-cell CLL/lymphoma 9 protein isoform X1 [Hypomesus transpacificus]XP_046902369.1 B-cell CLL/lymphoma 9 protein isoform X1 [Hypomesus transpacificus]